jgi:hypothetical protein
VDTAALAQVKQTLLRRPSRINAARVALRLVMARDKCSEPVAQANILSTRTYMNLVSLFQKMLPDEFKKARTTSSAELARLFVSQLGFPIEEDWLFFPGYEFPESIPIAAMNPHICDDCEEPDFLSLEWKVVLLLLRASDGHTETVDEHWEVLADFKLPEKLKPSRKIEIEDLKVACAAQSIPALRALPAAINLVAYNTGSVFFDFDPNLDRPDLDWNVKNILWLREQWKLVPPLEAELNKFCNWFHQHQRTRVIRVLKLYQEVANASAKRGRDAERRTLVRIL